MPGIYGEPLPSEIWGTSATCAQCGADVPTLDGQGLMLYEESSEQLCHDCSPTWNGIYDRETDANITPG